MATTARRTPPVNAQLTAIYHRELIPDGGGTVSEELVEKWSGEAPAYVTERIETHALSSAVIERAATVVVFPSGLLAEVEGGEDFGPSWALGFSRLSEDGIEDRRVTAVEDRRDFGFIRAFTQEV